MSSPQGPPFPNLVPTARSMVPGDFPSKTFSAQSGIQSTVQYGSRRSGQTLELSYDNCSEDNAKDIYDHYLACKGTIYFFGVPENVKAGNSTFHKGDGSDSPDNRYAATPFGMKYKYAEPPQFVSVKPGRMSVTIKLVGVLDS